jgi:hypothetical protein
LQNSRGATLATVCIIVLASVLGTAATTYYVFLPRTITTELSTVTDTTLNNVTEIAPITTTQVLLVTSTRTATEVMSPVEISSFNRSSHLIIQLAMNSSTIFVTPLTANESAAILIMVSLYNTLPTDNNLSSSQAWPVSGLLAGPCSTYKPIGIAVMKGFYTSANISEGQPLHLFQQLFCPAYFPAAFYIFGPTSDYVRMISGPQASLSRTLNSSTMTSTSQNSNPLGDMEAVIPLNGSCCREIPGPQNCTCFVFSSIPFSTGTYTVAGGDEWGDLVILHFFVLP